MGPAEVRTAQTRSSTSTTSHWACPPPSASYAEEVALLVISHTAYLEAVSWSGVAGSEIVSSVEESNIQSGMAIGDGLLLVPAENKLTAFGN
jgi:hypothetical protein